MITARSPNVTLWSLPSGGPGKGQGATLSPGDSPDMGTPGDSPDIVMQLHVNASVEWREGAKGPARAIYE